MLQQAPASREAATKLAGVLQVRAEADAEFRAALQGWLSEVRAVLPGGGDVHNQISGGTQHGPVFQGRDFSGLAVSASPPPASDGGASGGWTPVPPASAEHPDGQAGGPMPDAAPSSALGIAELRECMWFLYDWATTLLVHLRDHPDQRLNRSIETPPAVSWPLLLAAPDADQLTRLEADLKTLRREVQRYHPAYLGSNPGVFWGDQPVRLIETGRRLVNAIHGMTVTFAGEHQRAGMLYDGSSRAVEVRNEVSGGHSGNVVQVGNNYGGVHISNALQDDPSDSRDPLVIAVEVRYGSAALDLVVDADPPRAMAPSGTLYVVTVQARTTRAVILHRVRPVVLSRRQPRRACSIPHILGKLEPRKFTADFDAYPPRFEAEGDDFPFTVSATDPEQFWFTPAVSVHETAWRLELDWSCLDHSGTAVIDNGGLPFESYPHTLLRNPGGGFTALHFDCEGLGMRHQPDCPALRLNGSRRNVFPSPR